MRYLHNKTKLLFKPIPRGILSEPKDCELPLTPTFSQQSMRAMSDSDNESLGSADSFEPTYDSCNDMPAQIPGAPTVQPVPGAADKFTFLLAAAMQMMPGSTYYPEAGSAEWDYFMHQGIEVLKALSYVANIQDTYPDAFANCGYVDDLLHSRAIVDSISVRCAMMKAVPSVQLEE